MLENVSRKLVHTFMHAYIDKAYLTFSLAKRGLFTKHVVT